jgi:hypothetical protein
MKSETTTGGQPQVGSDAGLAFERRFSVAEIKRYAESFLIPANCGDDAADGGRIENKQLWIMLGNIDYCTGQGTIGDFTDKANAPAMPTASDGRPLT